VQVAVREQLTEGIENAGLAFISMMQGGNTGKAVVRVAQDPFPVTAQQ
jgi:NADPH-dependent curcumin reductase CurA